MHSSLMLGCVALCLSLFRLLWIALNFAPVNADAGYYLSAAELIADGFVPFRDFALHYTPLAIYSFAAEKMLLGAVGYKTYLGLLLAIEMLVAVLAGSILGQLRVKPILQVFGAIVVLFSMIEYQGTFIVLEPFVVLFLLAAVYLYLAAIKQGLRILFVLAGICVGLAFLSKQYGAFASLPIFLGVITSTDNPRSKIDRSILFLIGCALPPLLGIAYFWYIHEVSPLMLWSFLGGQRYPYNTTSTDRVVQFFRETAPYLIFVPFVWPHMGQGVRTVVLIAITMMLPLMFNRFAHHFILTIPFVTIVGLWMIQQGLEGSSKRPVWKLAALFTILVFSACIIRSAQVLARFRAVQSRAEQFAMAETLNQSIPRGSRVTILANPAYYYLGGYLTGDLARFGFGFLNALPPSDIARIMRCSDYVIQDPTDKLYSIDVEGSFLAEGYSLKDIFLSDAISLGKRAGSFNLWQIKAACSNR